MTSPNRLQTFETLARHASDLVHWVEGSGPVLDDSRPLDSAVRDTLDVTFIDAPLKLEPENILPADRTPKDLSVTHKPGLMVLWRLNAKDGRAMMGVQGVNESEVQHPISRPVEDAYKASATISDRANRLNPREVNLSDLGNFIDVKDPLAKGHEVKLYRSPLGTKMGSLGGLQGSVKWNTGEVASWAIITCEVTLKHTTGKRSFSAQADINGDFRLAFSSLPFPKKEGDERPPYKCTLKAKALKSASGQAWHQPDDFVDAEVKKLNADEFSTSIDLDFHAGSIQRLKSSGSDAYLVLKT